MPLLKRKAFQKSTVSEYLRDDDEVFHCELTDEIFKDYEEYCERIILVNSMVWSCEMTGKNNLTYAEALESEKAARRSLRDFPMELKTPVLYIASKTNRSSFAEMTEDVFNYVRERYFVGETIEACLEGDVWSESHVLSVTAPKQHPGSTISLPASAYCYEVEQFEDMDAATTGQIGTVPYDRVRRRKGVYTRDKSKLFLKQFVQQGPGGIICIKKEILEKYHIDKVVFNQMFTGNPPEFPSSKKLIKNSLSPPATNKHNKTPTNKLSKSPDKKRQESMDKFVKKTDKNEINKPKASGDSSTSKAHNLAERMRIAGEQMKQRKMEEKEKLKEKNARLQAYMKEWQKVKDDLELEDHKAIPKGTPVVIEGIPDALFGDFLSVLEFVHLYADTLKTKDVFHNGLDIDLFRKALTLKEHAGVFSDLIQMLLTTIFSLQEDEAEEYNEAGRMVESTVVKMEGEGIIGATKAVELATKASKWSQTYLGTPLRSLQLDPTTVTEVLRLHLLSSGAEAGSRCATWRYQQRGGYSSYDDAGLHLKRTQPVLLCRLQTTHVADLPIDEKFKVLQCLMNQILSYATLRDIIEEKLDTWKITRTELRVTQIAVRKHDSEQATLRTKLKKEYTAKKEELKLYGEKARAHEEELKRALEKLAKDGENKKADLEKKAKQLQNECFDYQSYLGNDRGYRRYYLNQCVPGLFVEAGGEPRGPCLDKPVLPSAPATEDTLAYVRTLFEKERASSDKENDSAANSRGNSPKKPLSNLNGLNHKLNALETNTQLLRDLYVCTGNMATCLVHGKEDHPKWTVYNTEEQIESLINSLNKRGIRELELKQNLEMDKQNIVNYVVKCPMQLLNPLFGEVKPAVHSTRQKKFQPSLSVPADHTLSEALELSLRDYILELEEKIFHGCLGVLKVKDREAWRGTIMVRGYDKQAEYLSWGPRGQYRDDYHLQNGKVNLPTDGDDKTTLVIPENKYRDPGYYLADTKVKTEDGERAASRQVVRGLASALLQISQAIHHKYLKRPLGLDDKERKDREAKGKSLDFEALERWEVSLMECQSFAQVAVHLFTLDSSVCWSASILNASCRICRRKTDPDNMLLCDTCNKGHHLYCLKPKLTKVPEGDWFCDQCKPKERTPRKRRKLFSDEDLEEATKSDSEDENSSDIDLGVCSGCGSGGRLGATCRTCGLQWHAECAEPRPARASSRWTCKSCLAPSREHTTRRCAATAINNIHHYAKQLNDSWISDSGSEDSDDNVLLVKLKGRRSRNSKEPSPLVNGHVTNGHTKRARKSKEEMSIKRKSRTSGSHTPVANGHVNKAESDQKRKRRRQESVSLHTDALQDLLRDVMKNKDSWPFCEPVSAEEVPDYFEVIEEPMDFTTIKQKLTDGEYTTDEQLMSDAALVFTNCYVYNQDTHIVAKAGMRLQKFFMKRCSELELPGLPDLGVDDDSEAKEPKRPRTSK